METKAIKLGSWEKHPASVLLGLECHVLHMRNGINVMEYFSLAPDRSTQMLFFFFEYAFVTY